MVRKSTSPPGVCAVWISLTTQIFGMAHLQRAFEFGRKRLAESEFGGLYADPLAALAIESLIDHAHAAFAHFANNFKSAGDNLAGLKGPVERRAGNERFAQEVAHPLFPIDRFFHFTKKFQVTPAFILEERATFGRGPLEGGREKLHYALVLVGAVFHCPTLNRSNSHLRERYHSR